MNSSVVLDASWLPGGMCELLPWLPVCNGPPQAPPSAPMGCAEYGCVSFVSWHQCHCNSQCSHHGSCCSDYSYTCQAPSQTDRRRQPSASPPRRRRQAPNSQPPAQQNVMTLYHTTSPATAELILKSSFRPGHSGWCGGAIYFYTSPNLPPTKLGPDSSTGAVIEAQVNMGRMAHLDSKCDGAAQAKQHYDSITFNPGDGAEYLVWSSARIISMRRYS